MQGWYLNGPAGSSIGATNENTLLPLSKRGRSSRASWDRLGAINVRLMKRSCGQNGSGVSGRGRGWVFGTKNQFRKTAASTSLESSTDCRRPFLYRSIFD